MLCFFSDLVFYVFLLLSVNVECLSYIIITIMTEKAVQIWDRFKIVHFAALKHVNKCMVAIPATFIWNHYKCQ